MKPAADLFPETMIVELIGNVPMTDSLQLAAHFKKRHTEVLRAQTNLECSEAFRRRNFASATYLDAQKKPRQMVRMTRNGFAFLAMGFTGKEAAFWKESFLERFDTMETELHARTQRFAAALDMVRPNLRPVVEGTQGGLARAAIAAPLGKSCAAVTYHRSQARRLGLLRD